MTEFLTVINSLMLLVILGVLVRHDRERAAKKGDSRQVLLDTSVLIDGRIAELGKTGFLNDDLLISRGVINELQMLADGADHDKRMRARYGLDVIRELQEQALVKVTVLDDNRSTPEGVDHRLLNLARQHGYWLCTIDYNLNKVAKVEGVSVLNINELAQSIRMAALPGERIDLKLTSAGQDKGQALGYLKDGAMVVVADAANHIGETLPVVITKSLQTEAGKMMFAELVEPDRVVSAQQSQPKQSKPKTQSKPDNRAERNPNKPKVNSKPQRQAAPRRQERPKGHHSSKSKPATSRQRNSKPRSMEDRLMQTIKNQK